MTKKMLIDATYEQETRVAVVEGKTLTDFEFELADRKPLKGNIYLARITRVEPSLQAAFIEYGGNRHGFLPFPEIHPDYYQIPVEDASEVSDLKNKAIEAGQSSEDLENEGEESDVEGNFAQDDEDSVQGVVSNLKSRHKALANKYQIQDVIKAGQVVLVQVIREERGLKGAAVTTYLSLAGRFCVLMPNSPGNGGVSRKITDYSERSRMKGLISEMNLPKEMSIIIRTAGVGKSNEDIKRDQEYLIRLWNGIRELTLKSEPPQFIYEEANLIKRALRDLFNKGVEEVLIEGEKAYKSAKKFMELLAPNQVKNIYEYTDDKVPLFMYYQVEKQIDNMNDPFVKLPSGGSIVIHPTEALVSIDVNSGKSVKESNIEETALKTNIEAADEIARQMKLRDIGGLVVIDFIDMEDNKHNIAIERKMKNAVLDDRARIQIGRISPFGLLEMSRQRLASSLMELNYHVCPHCSGTGREMTIEASSVMLLRNIKEDVLKHRIKEMNVKVPKEVCMYILNHNRDKLSDIEKIHDVKVHIISSEELIIPNYEIEVLDNYSKKQKSFKVASDAITGSDFMKKDNSEFINLEVSEDELKEYNKERKEDFKNFSSNKRHNRSHRGGSNRSRSNNNNNKNSRNNNSKGKNNKNYKYNSRKPNNKKPAPKKGLLKRLFS